MQIEIAGQKGRLWWQYWEPDYLRDVPVEGVIITTAHVDRDWETNEDSS